MALPPAPFHTLNADRTILGPLTTVFEPPASCSVAHPWCSDCPLAWVAQTCAGMTVQDNPSCWPETATWARSGGAFMFGWGFYSPGVVCPAGHTAACQATAGGKSDWKSFQYKMESEEVFVGCCPTGYKCHNENGQTCISEAGPGKSFATVFCEDNTSNNFGYKTIQNTKGAEVTLYAPMIQIAWKPTDEALRLAVATAISFPQAIQSRSLSTGTIAGIVVGSVAFLIGILAAILFVWRSKRKAAAADSAADSIESNGSSTSDYTPTAELKNHTNIYTGHPQTPEPWEVRSSAGSRTIYPMAELGMDGPVELPGPEASPRELMHRRMMSEDETTEEKTTTTTTTTTSPATATTAPVSPVTAATTTPPATTTSPATAIATPVTAAVEMQ
ncbi:hypothetical protein QBC38DRAFT_400463 [Podospora fimiseda]|uniref:Uncharacterized protein n=1 Tax=Podospora fimiseda TaxID=252190 RepID=A0AAN7BG70_9PEZI|nr:hypothetical protein QBC38DRAFT_400463 [Podospora fimiseda]